VPDRSVHPPQPGQGAVLLGTPTGPGELGGWVDLATYERRRKLNAMATAVCAIVPPSGGPMVHWLWEQRIARITQAALLLVHICQGNEAGLEPEVEAEAIRTLWPAAA
jgi:hypothetical protein